MVPTTPKKEFEARRMECVGQEKRNLAPEHEVSLTVV